MDRTVESPRPGKAAARTMSMAMLALGLAAAPVAALAQGQHLRVAVPTVPPQLGNPYAAQTFGSPNIFFMAALYDGLTDVDANGKTGARIATAWKNTGPTTWQFTIRPGFTYSNGKPMTAQSIVDNINKIYLSDYAKTTLIVTNVPNPAGARLVDANTIEITTKQPNPIFDKEIGGLPIVEPGAWADLGVEGFTRTPVATGAYKVDGTPDWAGKSIKMVPNVGGWHPGKVAQLTIAEIPERQARVNAIESGQMDIAIGLNMDAYETITKAGHTFFNSPAPVVYVVPLVTLRPDSPFRDVRVRQAVNYALDKEGMNKNLLRGLATVASQPATPTTYGFNPDVKPYPYDPAKAKQLLAEAGYPNGFKTAMEGVMSGSQTADAEIYQQIGLDLARVGVQVDVIPVTFGDWLKKWTTARPDGTVSFPDMFGLAYFLVPEIDAVRAFANHWCEKKPTWYCNESLRPLITTARTEFDPVKREAALKELMRLSHDDAPVLFTVNQIDVGGVHKRVKNFKMVHRFVNYDEITVQ